MGSAPGVGATLVCALTITRSNVNRAVQLLEHRATLATDAERARGWYRRLATELHDGASVSRP